MIDLVLSAGRLNWHDGEFLNPFSLLRKRDSCLPFLPDPFKDSRESHAIQNLAPGDETARRHDESKDCLAPRRCPEPHDTAERRHDDDQ